MANGEIAKWKTGAAALSIVVVLAAELSGQNLLFPKILLTAPSNASAPSALARVYSQGGMFRVNAVAVDAQENMYVGGSANGLVQLADFPAVYGRKSSTDGDAIVAKFNRTGKPLWASFFGGNDSRRTSRLPVPDVVLSLDVDAAGQVYAGGSTLSTDFPIVGGFQPSPGSATSRGDGFIVKLSADGQRILYSTYYGAGDDATMITAIDAGPSGEIWASATTSSRAIFTTNDLSSGSGRGILLKLSPTGSPLWATRLPLITLDGLAADNAGDVTVGGGCLSACGVAGGPTTGEPGILRVANTGSQLRWAAILPAPGSNVSSLAVSSEGRVYVTGTTSQKTLAVRNAWQPRHSSGDVEFPGVDGWVGILSPTGALETLSYLGGSGEEVRPAIAAAAGGEFVVAVTTNSNDLQVARALIDHHVDGPVYRSLDRGLTWQVAGAPTQPASGALALSFDTTAQEIYAAASPLVRTRDLGATWISEPRTLFGPPAPERIVFDPRHPSLRYAAIAGNIYRFDESQNAWVTALLSQPGANLRVIAVSPHDSSVWVAGNFGVEVSVDGGISWSHRDNGLPPAPFSTMPSAHSSPNMFAFHPTDRATVYAGAGFGLYVTTDAGGSWQPLVTGTTPLPDVTGIAFDPVHPELIHLSTRNGGLLRCEDAGRRCTRKLSDRSLTTVATDPMKRHIVYTTGLAPDGTPSFYLSIDYGETWLDTSTGFDMRGVPSDLLVDPRDSSRLFASADAHAGVPYVVRFRPAANGSYAADVATYLGSGGVGDVAVTPAGDTVIAINQQWRDAFSSQGALVRIGR